jgi:hypothetical protein
VLFSVRALHGGPAEPVVAISPAEGSFSMYVEGSIEEESMGFTAAGRNE